MELLVSEVRVGNLKHEVRKDGRKGWGRGGEGSHLRKGDSLRNRKASVIHCAKN